MNTENENNNNSLGGAFDRGINTSGINYGHPHGEKILNEICDVLRESETGRLLLVFIDKNLIPVQIMKGTGESGFSADLNAIYLQIPGKIDSAQPEHIIHFAKALHEGAQEHGGLKTPDPQKDLLAYADFIHARNLDAITETLQILTELTNSLLFPVLIGALSKLGLENMYKAYLEGASREQLLHHYVEAYDKQIEGV